MKKLIALISGVSLVVLVGGVSLADEKEEVKKSEDDIEATEDLNSSRSNTSSKKDSGEGDKNPPKPEKNYNSSISNKSTKVATDGDDGEGDDIVQGSGDPLKGLNVTGCHSKCKGGEVDLGDDDVDTPAPTKDYNTTRTKSVSEKDPEREDGDEKGDSREEKQDDDG